MLDFMFIAVKPTPKTLAKKNNISSVNTYLLIVNNKNTCEICSKIIIKTPEPRQWRHAGALYC